MVTVEQFKQLFPRCIDPAGWVASMEEVFPTYGINTKQRCAAFIAQCGHESGGWVAFEENLNYSAAGLVNMFHKRFPTLESATPYARQPEKIANKVYSDRLGNGNEASGDGWKYRGRGPIQITGLDNYKQFAHDMFPDAIDTIIKNPELLATDKKYSLKSAIWYWNKTNLNHYADLGDIKTMTRLINGPAEAGLDARIVLYEKVLKVIT